MHTCLIYIYLYQIHIYITKQVFFFPDFFEFSYDFPIQNYVNKLYHTRQHVQGATTLSKKTPLKKKKKNRENKVPHSGVFETCLFLGTHSLFKPSYL